MSSLRVTAFALLIASPLAAQRPAGWQVRYDRANAVDSQLVFSTMSPGWHVTTGPSGILYNPAHTGTGNYTATLEVSLFPAGAGAHAEAFGMFVGGQHLTEASQAYTYFIIRKDGMFSIKSRSGAAARDIVPWTRNAAVVAHPGDDSNVKNVLAVAAQADSVRFQVNGTTVHTMARPAAGMDGVVGLRVNHGLNLHVSKLEVTPTAR